ncbi:MAG: signal peptide peptidase SppA [Dysgonamonadaceae bacterium]|jgi:protease-4|nr:signal peptide peptidase SppA [Dysgonamonadaceae bacterium]
MKSFFKMLFASCLGVFIAGFILFILCVASIAGIATISMGSKPTYVLEPKTVLKVDLTGVINDRVEENPFDFLLNETKALGLNDVISAIKKAKDNDKIAGIYLKAGMLQTGFASARQIRDALLSFKESGKFIVAYGDQYTQNSYYIASVASPIFLNPEGIFIFQGLGMSIQFEKGFYENIGIEWQVFKVGTFKSAVEPYIHDKMSDANKEQHSSILNDIWGTLLADISESRNILTDKLNQYADKCMTFADPKIIVANQLVDSLKYGDEVESYLKRLLDLTDDEDLEIASVNNLKAIPAGIEKIKKDKIAVLFAEGIITDNEKEQFFATGVITVKKYAEEIDNLKKDKDVKAVVFRVNSRGGSAFASEQIHHAVKALNEVKPVVVSMGDYAASGGYYIAAPASKIVAEPTTITGSIGIYGLIPSGASLAKKIGVTHDRVGTNKHSNFNNEAVGIPLLGGGLLPARPFNADESAMIRAYIERGYDTFLSRCADGRGKTKAEIDAIGQGRIWSGNQALSNGLIDELGGIDKAVEIAAGLAGVDQYSIEEYPLQKDFFTHLLEESVNNAEMRILDIFIGKEALERKQLLNVWRTFDIRQAVAPEIVQPAAPPLIKN